MEQLRNEIWDHLYRSGPQTVGLIASSLQVDAGNVGTVIEHEWFEVIDDKVQIAVGKPPSSTPGLIG